MHTTKDGFKWFWFLVRYMLVFIFKIVYNLKYEGLENIPKTGGHIFASNHKSNADPVLVPIRVPMRLNFMSKKEMFETWISRNFFRFVGCIPVERGKGDMGAVDEAARLVRMGKNFLIFPEGRRSKTGELQPLKSGVAWIAAKTHTDVIPCAVLFTGKLKFRSKIIVRYGKSIDTTEYFKSEVTEKSEIKDLTERITAEIRKLLDS